MKNNDDLYLSNERYLAVLERQKARIESGLALQLDDSTTPGNKYTHASWGLCSGDKEAWPDIEDQLFPDQFVKYGRVAPKYLQEPQRCPFDRRSEGSATGCFYKCRLFNPQKGQAIPSAKEAVVLYDIRIQAAPKTQ